MSAPPNYCAAILTLMNSPSTPPVETASLSDTTIASLSAVSHYFSTFYGQLFGYFVQRQKRAAKLQEELQAKVARGELSEAGASEARRKWARRETYYLRLRRVKASMSDFVLLSLIGKGGYGEVYLAKQRSANDRVVVLKRMNKTKTILKNEVETVKRERDIMVRLHESEWIAKLFLSFQTDDSLFFAMEYCGGGDLRTFLENCGPLEVHEARLYFGEMILAVADLHAAGYIHRDLKPANFVISHSGHLKLIDFGLSAEGVNEALNTGNMGTMALTMKAGGFGASRKDKRMTVVQKKEEKARRRYSMVGSPEYMAPEVLEGTDGSGYTASVDMWSLGVVLYEMLVGVTPFDGSTPEEVFANVWQWKSNLVRPEMEQDGVDLDDAAWDLISRLVCDAATRLPSPNEAKSHPFLAGLDMTTLAQQKPPFVPQLDSEFDTSYFEVDADLDIAEMIRELEHPGQAARKAEKSRLKVGGFTFKPADLNRMRQFQEQGMRADGAHTAAIPAPSARATMVMTPGGQSPAVSKPGCVPPAVAAELTGVDWFRPTHNRSQAEAHLANAAPGQFVIRPSSQSNSVALSHRRTEGYIGHAVIKVFPGAGPMAVEYQLEDKPTRYMTVRDLLATLPLTY